MRRGNDEAMVVLSRDAAEALAHRIFGLTNGRPTSVWISSGVGTSAQFARGDSHLVTEGASVHVSIALGGAFVSTTRLDDASLKGVIAQADAISENMAGRGRQARIRPPRTYGQGPKTFYESIVAALRSDARRQIFDQVMDASEAAGLIAAGDISIGASTRLMMNTGGFVAFQQGTYGEFTLTARTKDGQGSGWGWSGCEDWDRVNPDVVIARAIDLAVRSAKPVAVEPGRYTVILEPSAVHSLVNSIDWSGSSAEAGESVFSKDPVGTTKIGLKMTDERVSLISDPWDPELPHELLNSDGNTVGKYTWFEGGVLKMLAYGDGRHPTSPEPLYAPDGLRLSIAGRPTSFEDMIASTKRGIWINRLSGGGTMNARTYLITGTTRDGTFLIENGKITKAIKNLRFTESPFFILNKLEAWGEPVRASQSVVAPRLKVRDFDFTSLTDAI